MSPEPEEEEEEPETAAAAAEGWLVYHVNHQLAQYIHRVMEFLNRSLSSLQVLEVDFLLC